MPPNWEELAVLQLTGAYTYRLRYSPALSPPRPRDFQDRKEAGQMETIGKILSITLLTIFGSAAATVYLVDSNFLTSVLGSAPVTYSSDTEDIEVYDDFPEASRYRESQKTRYVEIQSQTDPTDYSSENNTIWGQSYDTTPSASVHTSQRAAQLAQENTAGSLEEKMDYWNERYKKAVKYGESGSADLAYKNYLDYKQALRIKRAGDI